MEPPKKVRVVLKNSEKLNLIGELDKGTRPMEIADKYGVSRSFIYNLKNKKKRDKFQAVSVSTPHILKQKNFKTAKNELLEKSTYMWFCQKRSLSEPISGPLLCEKALILNAKLNGDSTFKASHGWLNNFKRRHGIHYLSLQGERLSSDKESAEKFVVDFKQYIEANEYETSNIYNADESGLNWRSLPRKTLVCSHENVAPGRKVNKDRVTAMFCANASGSHKIPILIIGKYQKPRCFKNVTSLPVTYKAQSSAWMDRTVFLDWYTNEFIPLVKAEKARRQNHGKVLLLLDNAPSHPPLDVLNAVDKDFDVMYLPPNVTAIIQPMDQGVIETVKKLYRKSLARKLLLEHEGRVEDFIKKLNLKDCCDFISDAWNHVTSSNLLKAWKAFFPYESLNGEVTIDQIVDRQQRAADSDTFTIFSQIPDLEVSEPEIVSWMNEDIDLPGWEPLSDETIIRAVREGGKTISSQETEQETLSEEEKEQKSIASAMSDILAWYENHENCTPEDLQVLRKIETLAKEEKDAL